MQEILILAKREFTIHMARKSEWLAVLLFYVIFISMFPIAFGLWPRENIALAPVIIWIAALVATLLAQESLLRADFKLGAFDIMLQSDKSFSWLILTKIFIHWLVYALPMVTLTPFLAVSFSLPILSIVIITGSLFLGSLFLSLMAAVGAALTVPLARGGIFLAILILPLYVPMLCLGSNLGILSVQGIVSTGHLALLLALVITAVLCVPLAVATAIKVSIE